MENINKIDLLLQYILLVAGREEEYTNRDLGPIHLIKYVYIADLFHAKLNNGQIYTGLKWKFHHYGPWALECFERIEPALEAIGAEKKILHSTKYEDDFTRWTINDEALFEKLERQISLSISGPLHKYIHRFGSDTAGLLDFVYKTWPMLNAKPEDTLDFTIPHFLDKTDYQNRNGECQPQEKLSVRQQKKRKELISAKKEKFKALLESKRRNKIKPTPPRYDEVYFEGLAELEAIPGAKTESGRGVIRFSDDIWKSKVRFDPDVL